MSTHTGRRAAGPLERTGWPHMAAVMGLLATRGATTYGGEPVTVLEHGLQSAVLAEADGSPPALITAALLHDLGWLLGGGGGHEIRGCRILASVFGPAVAEPVRLHVAAKRYLCARDETYRDRLSGTSARTLAAEGGPMDRRECEAFDAEPWAGSALALRDYDDRAKRPGAPTPDLGHFADVARACLPDPPVRS